MPVHAICRVSLSVPMQVGEFLGSHQVLGMATMHAYIDHEAFRGLVIDAALRQLLSGFRLPGA